MYIYDHISFRSSYNDNVSDKTCTKNQNTHLVFRSIVPKIVPFMIKYGKIWWTRTGHMGMRSAYWIPMAIDTHSEYELFIAFQLQQLLQERAPMLRL